MSEGALRHYLERAIDLYAARLDDGFPPCFDRHRLTRDVPAMTERVSAGAFDATDPEQADMLTAQADVAFRVAHVAALAVLSIAEDRVDDPEGELEGFGTQPDDDEEEAFGLLVAEVLGPAEEFLHDPEVEIDDRGVEVQRLFALAWPLASEFVALSGLFGPVAESGVVPAHEAAHPVLAGVARLAVLLAALRWMARYPADDER